MRSVGEGGDLDLRRARQVRATALTKLRAEVEAGWWQAEESRVHDLDPEAIKRRGREKLAALRKAKR